MITTESTNMELSRFFEAYEKDGLERLNSTIAKKYRRILSKKRNCPSPIFAKLRISDNVTLHMYAPTVQKFKNNQFVAKEEDVKWFLVTKSLKESKPVLIAHVFPTCLFSTHAVCRYKERMGLDADLSFAEVCKSLVASNCIEGFFSVSKAKVYGTSDYPELAFSCDGGQFQGYYNTDTEIIHLETFLTPDMLTPIQKKMFDEVPKNLPAGLDMTDSRNSRIYVNGADGSVTSFLLKDLDIDPSLLDDLNQIKREESKKANVDRYHNKMRRKGYR